MEDSHIDLQPCVRISNTVFPLNQVTDVGAPMSKDTKLISREIIFELIQPICDHCT